MSDRIHTEDVNSPKRLKARILGRFGRHVHHTVRRTWSLEIPSWAADPHALDHCDCGATRHMWHGGYWRGGTPA